MRLSADLVEVSFDSIAKWDVAPNINLSPGSLQRGGFITARDTAALETPGIEFLIDGDPNTAYNPDDYGDVPRDLIIAFGLGATFRVDRIRIFPRLDRENRQLFPQFFKVTTRAFPPSQADQTDPEPITTSQFTFSSFDPNREPVVDRRFPSVDAAVVQLEIDGFNPWEIAEVEVYSDGSLPLGTFVSKPLRAPGSLHPVWGRVRYEGGDLSQLPLILQTRTGPQPNPIQYFRRTGVGDDLAEVSAGVYSLLPPEELGPVRSNPEWSTWETVSDGLVRSPPLLRHIQFRLFLPEPGTVLKRLVFEFTSPPIVQQLQAEIDPRLAVAGQEQSFALSMTVHMLTLRIPSQIGSTGFRQIQVLTDALIEQVEAVLVDDRPVDHTVSYQAGEGFVVDLAERIIQDGTFIQLHLRATLFRDGTRFEVRALDNRLVDGQFETVYHSALPGDVDHTSAGGELFVRLENNKNFGELIANFSIEPANFSPNGDGINDQCRIAYDLLKLTQTAAVQIRLLDLAGQTQRILHRGEAASGRYLYTWDGADQQGRPVAPGLYLCQLKVSADGKSKIGQGIVGVVR